MARGVDIYRYQTVTNWRALSRAVSFAWVKLTDGYGPAMVRGDQQVNGCRSVGIPVGGYHFVQVGDPVRQANVFAAELRRLDALDIAPALDLEDNPPNTGRPNIPANEKRHWAITFCQRIAALGWRPAIYLSASDAGWLRPDQWGIPGLVIWIAAYGRNDGYRRAAAIEAHYTGRVDVHQYTSVGRIPGISGNVDVNESFTNIANSTDNAQEEIEDMDAEQARKLDELWDYLLPGIAGRKSSGVMADYIRRGMLAAEAVGGELNESEARVLAAIKADAENLDVGEVAEALRERLGDELAESLGQRLLGQQSADPVTP